MVSLITLIQGTALQMIVISNSRHIEQEVIHCKLSLFSQVHVSRLWRLFRVMAAASLFTEQIRVGCTNNLN